MSHPLYHRDCSSSLHSSWPQMTDINAHSRPDFFLRVQTNNRQHLVYTCCVPGPVPIPNDYPEEPGPNPACSLQVGKPRPERQWDAADRQQRRSRGHSPSSLSPPRSQHCPDFLCPSLACPLCPPQAGPSGVVSIALSPAGKAICLA